MDKNASNMKKKVFLFHVDVVIEGYNKAMAQEALNALLRTEKIKYFQFESETPQSGEVQDDLHKPKKKEHLKAMDSKSQETKHNEAKNAEAKHKANAGYRDIISQIETFKKNNTLIRLSIVKSKGVKLSVPCRVLNYEDATQNVTIYHVDEKKVYQYSLNEIDDLVIG
jgi:hypothetical protein